MEEPVAEENRVKYSVNKPVCTAAEVVPDGQGVIVPCAKAASRGKARTRKVLDEVNSDVSDALEDHLKEYYTEMSHHLPTIPRQFSIWMLRRTSVSESHLCSEKLPFCFCTSFNALQVSSQIQSTPSPAR